MPSPSPCWFVAGITITDETEYALYLKDAASVFSRFEGCYLAVDRCPVLLEGNWLPGRIVLIEFPSKTAFEKWYYSSEYQTLLKHRLKGADCRGFLISGEIR